MQELKVKLIRDKPKKVYAATVEFDYHLEELIRFLTDSKEKKFDIIINGRLFKFNSIALKNKFIEGFNSAQDILIAHITEAKRSMDEEQVRLNAEIKSLRGQLKYIQNGKSQYESKEKVLELKAAAWKDRITELEETCRELRSNINEMLKSQ